MEAAREDPDWSRAAEGSTGTASYAKRSQPPLQQWPTSPYSPVVLQHLGGDPGAPYAYMAPVGPGGPVALPTVLAISGEEQLHVSRFFRAWRAEDRGWQVVVPLRPRSGMPYLFEQAGVDACVDLMQRILDDHKCQHLPYQVEAQKFHLVGTSNGGAAVLAIAAQAPELVASLTLVTGFWPEGLDDLAPLKAVPAIRLYVGDCDELGHCQMLEAVKEQLDMNGASSELFVLEGARHGNIGHYIDMEEFFMWLARAHAAAKTAALMKRRGWHWLCTVGLVPGRRGCCSGEASTPGIAAESIT